jgi:hypothetical protein
MSPAVPLQPAIIAATKKTAIDFSFGGIREY